MHIKKTGRKVDTAESGRKGLLLTRENRYDILFLDHMMPDLDGIETLVAIRSGTDNLNAQTPAVCLTANAVAGARELYLDAGFDDYLTKPIVSEQLERMIYGLLPDELTVESEGSGDPGDLQKT